MCTKKESLREHHVYLATIANQAERFDEMAVLMKQVAKLDVEFNGKENNLFNVACKRVTGALRLPWKVISSMEQEEKTKSNNEHNMKLIMIKDYRQKVQEELTNTCIDFLTVIDKHLLPSARTAETIVFYDKLKGDFYRYLAEFKTGKERDEATNESLKAYESASLIAVTGLEPIHPLRLGLALNIATLYYEVLATPKQAIHVAKKALETIADLDFLVRESSDTSTFIIKHLEDYLVVSTGPEDENVSKEGTSI